ncbi:hypothetical protein CEE44_03540 [Candidatus Woesearchaeota archaeon B3_Woes]|nr:MAG: hypothetical protein CEE44_03540 [Candidatus Woesearchaeota archaeon B3_Woes]
MQEKLLKQMIERMDILINLGIPPFSPEKYPVSGLSCDILKLCNAENTVEDIIKKTGKNRNQVDVNLSKLRRLGLIKSITKDGKIYYLRIK